MNYSIQGKAVEGSAYSIWGTSPIMGENGKVHLFVARWPCELKVGPGWRTHSEIAHYVGDSPEGSFVFSIVAMKGNIDGKAPCNPAIYKVYASHNPAIRLYALFYIVNDGIEKHLSNQYICLATSESLFGPWKKADDDRVVFKPSETSLLYN